MPRAFLRILDSLHRIEHRQSHILRRLGHVEEALNVNTFNDTLNVEMTMSALDDLEAQAQAQSTVIDGVRTTLQALRAELADALESGDTARIQAVVDQLDANTDALAEAIADVPDAEPTPDDGTVTPEPTPGDEAPVAPEV